MALIDKGVLQCFRQLQGKTILADALLTDQLDHGRILSTDLHDFKTYCWKNHNPFQNLLLPDT